MASQGGGEDLLISIGGLLFLVLSVLYSLRIKRKLGLVDLLALLAALVIQAVFLMMIEVASFSISIKQANGWLLVAWFGVYAILWLAVLAYVINKAIRWTMPSK